jgi:phosphoribosylanthranilate isomerase
VPKTLERGLVKVCGVTNVADAETAANAGATAVGVILAESPRRVSIERATEITSAMKDRLLRFAVFRNVEDQAALHELDALDVDAVQLHGAVSASLLLALKARPLLVVKALAIDAEEFDEFDETQVDAVLIDGAKPGSGATHSWERLRDRQFRVPVIAAGGLNPDNVGDVISETNPWGVDCASGVERAPGQKDALLVERYVANARAAFNRVGEK